MLPGQLVRGQRDRGAKRMKLKLHLSPVLIAVTGISLRSIAVIDGTFEFVLWIIDTLKDENTVAALLHSSYHSFYRMGRSLALPLPFAEMDSL